MHTPAVLEVFQFAWNFRRPLRGAALRAEVARLQEVAAGDSEALKAARAQLAAQQASAGTDATALRAEITRLQEMATRDLEHAAGESAALRAVRAELDAARAEAAEAAARQQELVMAARARIQLLRDQV